MDTDVTRKRRSCKSYSVNPISFTDYEQPCALDVLFLADNYENDQQVIYEEFKEQLETQPVGTKRNCPGKEFTHLSQLTKLEAKED